MAVQEILESPRSVDVDALDAVIRCVQECYSCAQICDRFADACLAARPLPVQAIRMSLDCAEMCAAAGAIGNRRIGANPLIVKAALQTCAAACGACADECERHAGHDMARACARACRECELACIEAIAEL
jgi:hypothetical protein